jgi:hypothetical protein
MESNIRGSSIVYQSLSYEMIKELIKNKNTPAWIKIWLYFSILQKYKKTIYAKNPYISEKLDIPLGTVKYAISKLKNDGLIIIYNKGTWARQIQLTKIANISENENKELSNNNEAYYHSLYDRTKYKENIYLSNDEYQALLDKVKDESELDRYLIGIDAYLKKALVKYESHFKLISIWIDKDNTQVKNKKKKFDTPNYLWYKSIERGYIENKSIEQDKELQDILDFDWLTEDIE